MFILPKATKVNRFIPKSAFDSVIEPKQKKILADLVAKIHLKNILSKNTVNLDGEEFKEIHVFEIVVKKKDSLSALLAIIDRVIPQYIVFVVRYGSEIMLSASKKHKHPTANNQAVVDWAFSSNWMEENAFSYAFNLKESLDSTFDDMCFQISGVKKHSESIFDLIALKKKIELLEKQIKKLKSEIRRCRQFNKQVELNIELKQYENKLEELSAFL